jgi:hypothetical protein
MQNGNPKAAAVDTIVAGYAFLRLATPLKMKTLGTTPQTPNNLIQK